MSDISKILGDLTQALKDSSSNELVTFLKEDAQRQKARDQMFMTLMQTMVTEFPRAQVPQPQPTPHPYYYSPIPQPAPQSHQSMASYGIFDGRENSDRQQIRQLSSEEIIFYKIYTLHKHFIRYIIQTLGF